MRKHLVSFTLLLVSSLAWSQVDQATLERRKAQIQVEIRAKQKLLEKQNTQQKSYEEMISQQSDKIKLREKLINTTEKQAKLLEKDIRSNQRHISDLDSELELLKKDYSDMIVKSYRSRSEQSRAMYLLSSENFLQAYKRIQYMKQYASYRKIQGEEIRTKTNQLTDMNRQLDVQKSEKKKLIKEQEKEKSELQKDKTEKEKMVAVIQQSKKKIVAEIKKKQQQSRAIDRQINKLIREAIAEANRKAAEEARRKAVEANKKALAEAGTKKTSTIAKKTVPIQPKEIESSSKVVLTPETKLVSDNFKANRGRLPWPVEKGTVYLGYGDQPHPVYKTLTVHNSGVDISTEEGATARSVFGGVVTKVISLTPVNKAVFIQHGDYFTVYQNLSSVTVSKGDKVNMKETIGRVRTNGDTGKTIIKFMILQNTTTFNPASWLFNM